MAGVGKTQMALALTEYIVHQYERDNPDMPCLRYLLKCHTVNSFLVSLRDLCSKLNFDFQEIKGDSKSQIKTLLRDMRSHGKFPDPGCSILIFDEVTKETEDFINSLVLTDGRYYAICTTNSEAFQMDLHMKIDGFGEKESIQFIKERSEKLTNKEPHKNVFARMSYTEKVKLAEEMSYSPLGLVSAVHCMIVGCVANVDEYLRMMKVKKDTMGEFQEGEYKMNLLSTLSKSLDNVKIEIENDKELLTLLSSTAFMNHRNIPLDLLSPSSAQERIHTLVEKIKGYSLGEVYYNGHGRVLDLHIVVQKAMKWSWNEVEKKEAIESCIVFLSNCCDKDTRFNNGFEKQMHLLPHCESVLKSRELDTIEDNVALISHVWLLVSVGHLDSQRSNALEMGEKYLHGALHQFSKHFLAKSSALGSTNDALKMIQCEGDLREKAAVVVNDLSAVLTTDDQNSLFQNIVLRKKKVEDTTSSEPCYMSEEDYNKCVARKEAVSKDKVTKIYLAEMLASILYTYARQYFYKKGKEMSEADKDQKYIQTKCMDFAVEIGEKILELHKVRVMPFLLARRQGTLYFSLEAKEGNVHQSVMQAKREYDNLKGETHNYYEFGWLSKDSSDTYHTFMCNRQLLRCYILLIQNCPKMEIESHIRYAKQFNRSLTTKEVDRLHTASAIYTLRGRFLMIIEEYRQAKELLLKACDAEERGNHFKYTWIEALEQLMFLYRKQGISKEETQKRISKCLNFVEEHEPQDTEAQATLEEFQEELDREDSGMYEN